jgi:hypothetical protein
MLRLALPAAARASRTLLPLSTGSGPNVPMAVRMEAPASGQTQLLDRALSSGQIARGCIHGTMN